MKALDVPMAVKLLFTHALASTSFAVMGLDGEDAAPDRVGDGRVLVEQGTPGTPDIDLSPVSYNYAHQIPVTIEAAAAYGLTGAQRIDAALALMSDAIVSDRFLGGLVDYLDATAPDSFDETEEGAPVIRVASVIVIATYSTPQPL